ncbi:ornithine cyclodeaminase family protein [Streptomyces sp. VRA16 Mangrove soil]|uniref:ornithine cyclodeaminase family protein n=1 Tax=Streptomyces sp. VRA16 Mangrove soil TaxID=2817434 RepID=UPI001A9F7462|nr:ornithine cyclodeaminase family protein [Streptomyces sp. VRA16 Mangrove soil]MBO1332841.1 ornithine cyclodeaminase family protein [Streptomyces sp. VRA16 Mangrove soil]
MTLILTRSTIRDLLADRTEAVAAAVATAHRDLALGRAVLPAPPALQLPDTDGTFVAMAAASASDGLAGVKLLADLPGNRDRGLPVQRSTVLVADADTGACLALLDGAELTRVRTAAATAVATDALARADAATLGLIGTGPLARAHVRALLPGRPYEQIVLWGRTQDRAHDLAAWIGAELGLPAQVMDHPRAVTEASDVLCTLTPSREPLVEGAWLAPGQHLNAVGAPPRPDHRELDTEAVRRCRVVVDAYDTARTKSGEVLIPLAEGALAEDDFRTELGDVLAGTAPGRTADTDLTLFDSVGVGLQDLAVARLLIDLAGERGLGTRVDLAT